MTTAIETVSAGVRRYVSVVGGESSTVPGSLAALAEFVVASLQSGEIVSHVVYMRNPRQGARTAAGIAVLTDRAVLLAEEGPLRRRISLWDIARTNDLEIELGGIDYPALELVHDRSEDRIVAAAVDGWSYDRARAELQSFGRAVDEAVERARSTTRPPEEPWRPLPDPSSAGAQFVGYDAPGWTRTPEPPGRGELWVDRPRPHWIVGTLWALVTVGALVSVLQGHPLSIVVAALAGAYSRYLFRGGRVVFFFW